MLRFLSVIMRRREVSSFTMVDQAILEAIRDIVSNLGLYSLRGGGGGEARAEGSLRRW